MKNAVLIINLGTPCDLNKKAIRAYLKEFLSDPYVIRLPKFLWWPILHGFILPFRPKNLIEKYEGIWLPEGSPLLVHSEQLVEQLKPLLPEGTEIALGMCYQTPSIKAALKTLQEKGVTHIKVLPLYPQFSSTTTAAAYEKLKISMNELDYRPKIKRTLRYAHKQPYIETLASHVQSYWDTHGKPQKLMMSFHGIPQSYADKGDPYPSECEKTAKLLADALSLAPHEWQLVYQSRFGKQAWLQPYCDHTLQSLPTSGIKHVHVICPGFPIDCLETLEEIAMTNRDLFLAAGGETYHTIPGLNASEMHAKMLLTLL